MKKRALSFFLLIVMLISLFPAQAFAVDVSAEDHVCTAEEHEHSSSDDTFEEVVLDDIPEAEEETDGESDPAEVPVVEAAPEEAAAEAVSVRFNLSPAELTLKVFSAGGAEAVPEEDGSYLLVPGEYYYNAECEGYISVSGVAFTAVEGAVIDVALEEDSVFSVMDVSSVMSAGADGVEQTSSLSISLSVSYNVETKYQSAEKNNYCKATITASVTDNSDATYSYVWQSSTDGSTWSDISGETAATLNLTGLKYYTCENTSYRVIVTETPVGGTASTVTSDTCTLDKSKLCAHKEYWSSSGKCKFCEYSCPHTAGYDIITQTSGTKYRAKCKTCKITCSHANWNNDENKCNTCGLTCEHTDSWDSTTGKCKLCGYAHTNHVWGENHGNCTVCGMEFINHDWNSTTGKCKTCEKGCDHSSWYTSGKCQTCGYRCPHTGETVGTKCSICKTCVHDWNSKTGKCKVCNWTCEHYDCTATATECACKICGMTNANHKWSNGKCIFCGYECPEHTYQNGSKYCSTCGKYCEHNWAEQGTGDYCAKCGTTTTTHLWNAGVCRLCKKVCIHDWAANHGNCTVCGMEFINHDWDSTTGKCTTCSKECAHSDWYTSGKCQTCGYRCPHTGETVGTKCSTCKTCVHDWDSTTGKCKVCTWVCEHYDCTATATECACKICGMTNANHKWSNGKCIFCGYECPEHTYVNGDYYCSTCGKFCRHTWEEQGTGDHCTTCDATTDAHLWNATITTIVDGRPGVCSRCGKKCAHDWSADEGGTYSGICKICEAGCIALFGKHEWNATTGACDTCHISCEHSWNAETGACDICKKACEHDWNAETGACDICKKACEHNWDVDAGVCKTCGNVCEPEITLNNTYLMLEEGNTATLTATLTSTVDPDFWAKHIKWSIDGADGIITLDDNGKITAVKAGTAYAVATIKFSGDRTFTAHCRVDVIAKDAVDNMKVQAGAASLTTELFSKDYAVLDILLIEGEKKTTAASDQNTTASADSTGIEITAAEFVDGNTKKIFDLQVVEGAKQLRIVPKAEYATLAKASEVKSSYTSKIKVTFAGKVQETEAVKLTVKKTQPKLKATVGTFNSFYSGQSEAIEITGATVKTIAVNTSKKNIDWVNLDAANKTLTLNAKAPLKNASGNVYLSVMTNEWTVPATVTLSVKNTYKAPKFKLSASSAKFNLVSSEGVELTLLPSVKDETLAQHNVNSLEVSAGYEVSGFDRETGAFTLKALKNAKAGKVTFSVGFDDTNTKVKLTLSAQIITPTIKLKTSSVTLNPKYDDSAAVDMVVTPADFVISGDAVKAVSANENLKAEIADGQLVVSAAKDALEYNKSYKVTVSIGSKKAVLTVKTAKKDADPTATVKATGAIDLTYPESAAVITATVKNYGGEFTGYKGTVTVKTGKTTSEPQEIDGLFEITQKGKVLTLAKKDGVVLNAGSTYTATITLVDGENDIEITAKPVKITVKQTAVNLKLSKSSVSLNKKADDEASFTVTCSTKNYTLNDSNVDVKVADKTGKKPYSVGNEPLDVSYSEGVLTVGVNDKTAYGATYKVLVSAGEGYKASTLTVTVLSSKKDAAVSLKASGSIDVLRGSSKVTLTPTYKNVNVVGYTEEVKIYSNKGSKTFATDATDNFEVEGREIANVSASSAYKYKAQIVTTFSNGYQVKSAKVAITVKSGSAKMKVVGTPRLYQKDAFARGEFSLTSTDSTLNGIAKVEMKSSKTAGYFELHNYGNGQFAIGFKDDTIAPAAAKLKTATVTLNIWHEGNTTEKADSTVSLKITIVK